jgi:hypothetical protein
VIRFSGQKLGGYNVQIITNPADVGVYHNIRVGTRVCTEAIVPRLLREALRNVELWQKPVHPELHGKVQSKTQREEITLRSRS